MDKSPDAFRTISEVAEQLGTPAHVLRFWESRFPQIRPVKRAGGRRYYRPSDVALLAGIRRLLHDDGVTIRGVQKILREQGVRHVAGLGGLAPLPPQDSDIEAVLASEFGPVAAPAADVAQVQTAQVISLEAALARAEGRGAAPVAPALTDEAEEVPEAPFVEAEEEPLPEPIALHAKADVADLPHAGADDGAEAGEQPAMASDSTGLDDGDQAVESLGESSIAMRLRRSNRADIEGQHAALMALRDRMADLRARLAKGVRRRAR